LLTEEQVAMIIQYIKSVGPKQGAAPAATPVPGAQPLGASEAQPVSAPASKPAVQ
jgi:hypothetical protein